VREEERAPILEFLRTQFVAFQTTAKLKIKSDNVSVFGSRLVVSMQGSGAWLNATQLEF